MKHEKDLIEFEVQQFRDNLRRAEADDDLGVQGELLNELGLLLKESGRFDEAGDAFRQSLQIVDSFLESLHQAKAQVLSNLGLLHRDQGELDAAMQLFDQARSEYESIGSDSGIAAMLVEMGIVHKDASRLSEALACLQQGLSGLCSNLQPTQFASAHVGLGLIHERRHNFETAREHYCQALKIYEETKDEVNTTVVLFNLGTLHDQQRNFSEAMECFLQSSEIAEACGDRMGVVHSKSAIASVLMAVGEQDKARTLLEDALLEAREIGYRKAEIDSLHDLAILDRDDGQLDRATERLFECQSLAVQSGDPLDISKAAFDCGDVFLTAGNYPQAATSYRVAADAVDSLRLRLLSEQEAIDVLDEAGLEVYDRLVRLTGTLLASPSESFEWSERARSREFLRLLRWQTLPVPALLDHSIVAQEKDLLKQVRVALARWQAADDADSLLSLNELSQHEETLKLLWTKMAEAAPEYVSFRRGEVIVWSELVDCLEL